MKHIQTYEARKIVKKENPYSVESCKNVTIDTSVVDKKESKQKIQYISKVFGNFECVGGYIQDDIYNLEYGNAFRNRQGNVEGMSILLTMNGDFLYKNKNNEFEWNNIILIKKDEDSEIEKEYKFKFNFHPVDKDGKFDFEQFKTNIDRMKDWIEDPESYKIFKSAVKYNL